MSRKGSGSFDYFGRTAQAVGRGLGDVPQASLTYLKDGVIRSHFHPIDQFQIFFGVPGATYLSRQVPLIMLHYTDAYSVYGPFTAKEEPMNFFSMRAERNTFIAFMPEDRDKLAWKGKRNLDRGFEHLSSSEFPEASRTRCEAIWERDEDGFEASAILAGPGATMTLPDTEGSSGQYIVVIDGSVEHDGKKFGFKSLGWQGAFEGSQDLVAGPEGARVFALRYPFPSTCVQHDHPFAGTGVPHV